MSTKYETRLFIAGEFADPIEGQHFPLPSPVDPEGVPVCHVATATAADVDRAYAAAVTAQRAWAETPSAVKVNCMMKFADLIDRDAELLATLDSVAMGKPVGMAGFEIAATSSKFRMIAGLIWHLQGQSSLNTPGLLGFTLRQPFGVVAAIVPWNVPALMWASKVAPAVAAGNAIIIKTSEKSPLSGAHLAKLTAEAGFPAGLINNLSGGGQSGKLLAEHMQIRAISFTGSTRTGRLIQQAAAMSNLKNCQMELGGKSPTLIFDDADIEAAVGACTFSISWNSGQICIANSRIYVQEGLYSKFLEAFKGAFGGRVHGDPADPKTHMGPQADKIQGEMILGYLDIGKKDATVAMGGNRVEGKKGWFIEPTNFTNVPDTSRISREEIFGPVCLVNTFKTEEEAIRRANDSEYGLYAAVFTKDINRAIRVAKALDAGTVGVNASSPTMLPDMPFGGYKQSGNGREGGANALEEWLETKSVVIKYQ